MTISSFDRSFRFVEQTLQDRLLRLVQASGLPHAVDSDGTLRYSSADTQDIENDLVCSIRDELFTEWAIFTLEGEETPRPADTESYREYMLSHGIPHHEERHNGFTWFLIPGDQDSHEWEVPGC